jgi:hypothetical protein
MSTHNATLFCAILATISLYGTHCEKNLSSISYTKIPGIGVRPAKGPNLSIQAFFLDEVWGTFAAPQSDYLQTLRKPYPHLGCTAEEL